MLDKDPVTQQKVMKLFKKHFYNFKTDLRKLMDGEDELVQDNENDQGGTDDRDVEQADRDLDDIMERTLDVLDCLDFALRDFKKAAILKEIFDKPLAPKDDF